MYRIAEAGVCVMIGKLVKIWLALFFCLFSIIIAGGVAGQEHPDILVSIGAVLLLVLVAYSLFLVLLFMVGMVCAVIMDPADYERIRRINYIN